MKIQKLNSSEEYNAAYETALAALRTLRDTCDAMSAFKTDETFQYYMGAAQADGDGAVTTRAEERHNATSAVCGKVWTLFSGLSDMLQGVYGTPTINSCGVFQVVPALELALNRAYYAEEALKREVERNKRRAAKNAGVTA